MEDVLLYMSAFFMVFFSCTVVCFCLRFSFWIYTEYWPREQQRRRNTHIYLARERRDRQGNTCPQANGTSRDNGYNDIFFIEPNSPEAARIRAQLEKDDKELPSYDEVMRIANNSTPTAAPTAANFIPAMPSALTMGASSSSVNANDAVLTVPPYREAATHLRPLTPPPYTPEPIGSTVVLPITTPLHTQQNTPST